MVSVAVRNLRCPRDLGREIIAKPQEEMRADIKRMGVEASI
jgi:hypothetical protein